MSKVASTIGTIIVAPFALIIMGLFAITGIIGDKWAERKDRLRQHDEENGTGPVIVFVDLYGFYFLVRGGYAAVEVLAGFIG